MLNQHYISRIQSKLLLLWENILLKHITKCWIPLIDSGASSELEDAEDNHWSTDLSVVVQYHSSVRYSTVLHHSFFWAQTLYWLSPLIEKRTNPSHQVILLKPFYFFVFLQLESNNMTFTNNKMESPCSTIKNQWERCRWKRHVSQSSLPDVQ